MVDMLMAFMGYLANQEAKKQAAKAGAGVSIGDIAGLKKEKKKAIKVEEPDIDLGTLNVRKPEDAFQQWNMGTAKAEPPGGIAGFMQALGRGFTGTPMQMQGITPEGEQWKRGWEGHLGRSFGDIFRARAGATTSAEAQKAFADWQTKQGMSGQMEQMKDYVDLINAMKKGKPTAFQLKKLAQAEAYRRMGGSTMVGINPKRQKEYNELKDKLYKQYLKEFGVSGTEIEEEENIDFMDMNW